MTVFGWQFVYPCNLSDDKGKALQHISKVGRFVNKVKMNGLPKGGHIKVPQNDSKNMLV